MAIGTTQSSHEPFAPGPSADSEDQNEHFIQSQLQRTGRHIRLADILSEVMTLAAGVLAALLLVILVDHWIIGLGFWARLLALIGLVGSSGLFVARRLMLPLMGRVNPIFSAHLIEQSEPSLKNSLINFLFLRSQPDASRPIVFRAMQQRAASDLARVEVDSAVDRSRVIHVGYFLAAILAICGWYIVFSPKDPFQTVARVAAPWKQIARPSRVQITDVLPGEVAVYYGRSLDVSAVVHGRVDSELPVWLVYSSLDGQIVDRRIPMRVPDGHYRYQCRLPEDDSGIVHDLIYRIEAGDALTDSFRITVLPAPSLVVESVEYTYPAYTARPAFVVPRQGDISALEGTQVRIRAHASEPIKSAYVEFDPPSDSPAQLQTRSENGGTSKAPRATIAMTASGREAEVRFTLLLEPDRQTPWHSQYQLRFITESNDTNRQPVLHRIDVTPDLAPLVEILEPSELEIEVPVDGHQIIEVRAVDPDFALMSVTLRAVSEGNDVLNQSLLAQPQPGQVVEQFSFAPRQLGLNPGDVAVYWATAQDNRTSPRGAEPAPNTSRTNNYKIRVVAPRGKPQNGAGASDSSSGRDEETGRQGDEETRRQGDKETGRQGDEETRRQGDKDQNEPEASGSSSGRQGQSASSQERSGTENQSPGGGGQGEAEPQANRPQSQDSSPRDREGQSSDGSGAGQQEAQGGKNDPLPSTGERDGDAWERILQRMREQRREQPPSDAAPEGDEPAESNRSSGDRPASSTSIRQQAPKASRGDEQNGSTPMSGSDEKNQQTGQSADGRRQTRTSDQEDPNERSAPADQRTRKDDLPKGSSPTGGGTSGEDQESSHQPRGESPNETGAAREAKPATPGESDRDPFAQGPRSAESSDQRTNGDSAEEGAGERGRQAGRAQKLGGSDRQGSQRTEGSSGSDTGAKEGPRPAASSSDQRERDGKGEQVAPPSQATDRDRQHPSSDVPAGDRPSETGPRDDSSQPGSAAAPPEGSTDRTGDPTGGGQPGGGPAEGPSTESDTEPGGDEANLEFARKATDLALEYLKDQQDNPDRELLERLGWNKEDMQKFIQRWQHMKREAQLPEQQGERAQRELDEALRSLGLRPGPDRLRRNRSSSDSLRGLRESGRQTTPPAEYRDQYDAYLRSTAKQRSDE